MADDLGQMIINLGHDQKKSVIVSVRTTAMVMTYTSIECKSDSFEDQIVKTQKRKILGVVYQWDKTISISDPIRKKKL